MIDRVKLMSASALVGLLAAGAYAAPAMAQDSAAPAAQQDQMADESAAQADEEDDSQVEELVITGSRIRRNEFSSPAPITVITQDQASLQGLVDTAEILQASSVTGGSFQVNNTLTGYVTEGGPGVNTISLRGLGASRTLVLFNGRRLPPAGVRGTVGPVDLNTIPNSLVERVEILKDGASSIYGSDAVAGVVNYITSTNFDGAKLNVSANIPFQSGGETYSVDGAWGKTFDRGYINVAASYYNQTALRRGDRDYSQCAADYLFDPETQERVDYKEYNSDENKCYNQVNNVLYSSAVGGYLQYLQPDVTYPTAAQGNNSPFADMARQGRAGYPGTYPYANYSTPYWNRATLLSPSERVSLYAGGGFDITPNIQAYGELLYTNRNSRQDSTRQLFPTLAANNPNNRFFGSGVAGGTVYPVISTISDSEQDVDYYRALGGLKGDFAGGPAFLSSWNWDVYAQYGLSSGDYSSDSIYNDRVLATTAYGVACEQAAITISGGNCSALPAGGIPWTSARVLAGDFTPEERAFLFGVDRGHTDYEQYMAEASASGDLFTLPAGPVGAAIGVVYRHDRIDDQPGRESVNNNNWGLTAAGHTEGSDSTSDPVTQPAAGAVQPQWGR